MYVFDEYLKRKRCQEAVTKIGAARQDRTLIGWEKSSLTVNR
jgi:hypothetical protein